MNLGWAKRVWSLVLFIVSSIFLLRFVNQAEVKVVIELIKHLKEIKKDAEIGVITFYREQVKKFSDALRAKWVESSNWELMLTSLTC